MNPTLRALALAARIDALRIHDQPTPALVGYAPSIVRCIRMALAFVAPVGFAAFFLVLAGGAL